MRWGGKQGGVAVATTTRVVEASPHRVTPKCPHFGDCGGCQLQHAAYAHQLELKRQVVEEAWARAGLRLPPDASVLGMDNPWRYRIRGEFEAVPTPDGWRFGFHRLRSHSDRKSTRLNSSHDQISYAVFCLKKKKKMIRSNSKYNKKYMIQKKI